MQPTISFSINLWWVLGLAGFAALVFILGKMNQHWESVVSEKVARVREEYTFVDDEDGSLANRRHGWVELDAREDSRIRRYARIDRGSGDLWLRIHSPGPTNWVQVYNALRHPGVNRPRLISVFQSLDADTFLGLANIMGNPREVTETLQGLLPDDVEPDADGPTAEAPDQPAPGPAPRRKRRLDM